MNSIDIKLEKANNILCDILEHDIRLLSFKTTGVIRRSNNWEKGDFLIKIYLSISLSSMEKVLGYWITLEELENFEKEKEYWAFRIYFDLEAEIRKIKGIE